MRTHYTYNNIYRRFEDIFEMAPTDLGSTRLTKLYKFTTSRLKIMPFIYIVPLAVISSVVLYIALGQLLIKLASLLQHGF